jgi:hypothetical protein
VAVTRTNAPATAALGGEGDSSGSSDAPARRRAVGAAVGLAVVAGVVLRFVTTSHLWLDEALSVDIAALPIADLPDALRHDGHPPLYYALLHGWMRLVGDGDVAVRALSGVVSLATLPLAHRCGHRLAGRAGAWCAVVLVALNPFVLRYATETRMYSLVMVLVLAGHLLVRRAIDAPTPPRLLSVTVVAGLLLLTHYWTAWLVLGTALVLLGARRARVAVATVASFAFLLPWLPVLVYQAAHTGTPWSTPPRPTSIVATSLTDIGGGEFAEGYLVGFTLLVLALVGLTATSRGRWRLDVDLRTVPGVRGELAVVAATVALGAVAGYLSDTTFATRYAATFAPLLLLAAAVGVARLPTPAVRAGALAIVVIGGLAGAGANVVDDRTQAGAVAAAIRDGVGPADVVAFCPDQLGPAVHRLLPDTVAQVTFPRLGNPAFVDWVDYAERNAASDPEAFAAEVDERAGTGAVWLVTSGAYRTLEGRCEALTTALAALRPGTVQVVAEDPETFYEHAGLFRAP